MTRGIGAVEALQAALDGLVPVFALVTTLGDLWLYLFVLSVLYWAGDRVPVLGEGVTRERAAFVIGVALGALALTLGLKGLFALPRPPGATDPPRLAAVPDSFRPLYARLATEDGFGFPSGHALGTAAVWGGLAWVNGRGRRQVRLLAAGAVVALVSLSRVVLGLHYLVDVVAGAVLGAAYLAVVLRFAPTADRALAVALAVAVGALAVAGPTADAALAVGATVAGLLSWRASRPRLDPGRVSGREALLLVGIGLPLVGGAVGVALAVGTPAVAALLGAAAVAALLALPLGVSRAKEVLGGPG